MLLGNGFLLNKLPLSQVGGQASNNVNIFRLGDGSFSNKASIPEGYGGKSYIAPFKAGSISVDDRTTINISGYGTMGINIEGSADASVWFANADGKLIVSGQGSSTASLSSSANVTASMNGTASTVFTIRLNHLSMMLDANGYASANLGMVTSGQGTLMAVAVCEGSTVDTSGLTPASVWAYGNRTLTSDSSSGGLTAEQAAQLMKTATKADVINAAMM